MKIKIIRDRNGNKKAKIEPFSGRGFAIFTNGVLPLNHRLPVKTEYEFYDCKYSQEIVEYSKEYGTDRQRLLMGV